MKIVYTKHASGNFKRFGRVGIKIVRRKVVDTIENPEHVDYESDKPKIIASKSLDEHLIL